LPHSQTGKTAPSPARAESNANRLCGSRAINPLPGTSARAWDTRTPRRRKGVASIMTPRKIVTVSWALATGDGNIHEGDPADNRHPGQAYGVPRG
jgi:hypothetical protein